MNFIKSVFLISSLLANSVVFAAPNALSNKAWVCMPAQPVPDNTYSVRLYKNTTTSALTSEVYHDSFIGRNKIASLSNCKADLPPETMMDGSTTVVCQGNNGTGSFKSEFSLGGFAPQYGSARLSETNEQGETEITEMHCQGM